MKISTKLLIVNIVFMGVIIFGISTPSLAQVEVGWTEPKRIPGYHDDTLPPILLADQSGVVHAFTSQWVGDLNPQKAIIYSKWTPDGGWTSPIDIILSPNKEARILDATLDGNDIVHVVFYGGDNTEGDLFYSKAPLAHIGEAPAWSTPTIIGTNPSDPSTASIVSDVNRDIVVIYGGNSEGNGLYSINSMDFGETWSDPQVVFLTDDDFRWPYGLNLSVGSDGQIYAIWNVVDLSGQGRGIYFASSNISDRTWSEPVKIAESETGLGTWWPTIVDKKGELFAAYISTPKVIMRRSLDYGKTWTQPSIISPKHIGVNGRLSLFTDGGSTLHLIWGQRIPGAPDIHGLWHSTWENGYWSNPEAIVSGPRVVDKTGNEGFDPYDARAIVSQGDVILATWRTDPGDIKPNGVWYSYLRLSQDQPRDENLGAAISLTLVQPPPIGFSDNHQNSGQTSPPTNKNTEFLPTQNNQRLISAPDILVIGILPAIIAIIFITFWYRLRKIK